MKPIGINLCLFILLNLLKDLIPNIIGITAAWKWASSKIEKNKINPDTPYILKLFTKPDLIYLSREIYHCPTTIISIVRTKGKAGYFVWKLAGGQGDQDINLPWGSLRVNLFFDFWDTKLFVANPLFIIHIKIYLNKNLIKGCPYSVFKLSVTFIRTERCVF